MSLLNIAVIAIVLSSAPEAPPASGKLEIPFEKYTLPNGLEVILHHDARLPTVTVNLWYHVGAYHESRGRSGFAHLFEHMMFQGSKHVGDDAHITLLEQAGGSSVNATTDYDRTNYFETVPSNQLETVLWLESDRMGFLIDTLTQQKLDTQRAVVKNERRETVETRPYGAAEERMVQELFPAPHPYHGAVIGSMADLDAATVSDVRDFFEKWYAPANATLVVAGDIDFDRTKALVAKYFGQLPRVPKPRLPDVKDAAIDHEVVLRHTEKVAKLPQLRIAWHGPGFFQEGNAAADLLGVILSDGKASRLEHRLITQKGLAQSVHASQESLYRQSMFEIQVTGRPGVATERLLDEVDAELEDIRQHGVTAQEVTRARNRAETSLVSNLQAVSGLGGKADTLQTYNHYLGDPGHLQQDMERFAHVTPQEIQKVAREWLRRDRRVVLHAVPAPEVAR